MKYLLLFLALSGCAHTSRSPLADAGGCYTVHSSGFGGNAGLTYKVTTHLKYGFIASVYRNDCSVLDHVYWRDEEAGQYDWQPSDCPEDIAAAGARLF